MQDHPKTIERPSITLYVRTPHGKTICLEIDRYSRVTDLKSKICSEIGMPENAPILLSHEGKTLESSSFDKNLTGYHLAMV